MTTLLLSQVYVPDPAAVGQHLHDLAAELVRRGGRVTVVTSARGYDDPSRVYPARETRDGVSIVRVGGAALGKGSLVRRALGGVAFLAAATWRALRTPGVSRVVVSTSPPMAAAAGWAVSVLRRVPLTWWVMDLNPDQAIATGRVRPRALAARLLEAANRRAARRARSIVVLDRFMATRVARWGVEEKVTVLPPWPIEADLGPIPHAENPFRREHGLEGKLVAMYSGNMSPVHPLTALLDAARALADDPRIVFLFVGGGGARPEVERAAAALPNVRLLPYQPREAIRESLSAADVHLVTMGDDMVGIVHPSKVYGAMAVARPILFVGPRDCHVTELLTRYGCGWQVDHDDSEGVSGRLRRLAEARPEARERIGRRGRQALAHGLDRATLCGRLVDLIVGAKGGASGAMAPASLTIEEAAER